MLSGRTLLLALVFPSFVVAQDGQKPPSKTAPKTFSTEEVYARYSKLLKKQLEYWRDARVSHLEFDGKIAEAQRKVAIALDSYRELGEPQRKVLDKARQWLADAVSGKAAWEKDHLTPIKHNVDKASTKIIDLYKSASPNARTILDKLIKNDIESTSKEHKLASSSGVKAVADKEVLTYLYNKHYGELAKLRKTNTKE